MRRLFLALLMVLHAGAARAETRFMVGIDTSWDLQAASPRIQLYSVSVPNDKLEHFLAGATIAWMLSVAGYNAPTAVAGSATAGALKEVRDMGVLPGLGHGDVEFADFVWTLMGGAAYVGIQALLSRPSPAKGDPSSTH
ncbi:MAG TPA: hypothetical protein V6D05_18265 [Stenomitos sp.]